METILWTVLARDPFSVAGPLLLSLVVGFLLVQSDFVGLLLVFFARLTLFGKRDDFVHRGANERPTGVVIIPSLLRNADDFKAITVTVESCATNGYPGELFIIASVDGRTDEPVLHQALVDWVARRRYASHVHVHVGGTPTRLGKMMAVEAGATLMREIAVAEGRPFPDVYFSIDGDGTLSPDSLERLAARLAKPHPLTGHLRRVVSGKICIRPDLFWRGWKEFLPHFFSVEGQIHMQVAREFLLSNVARYNGKIAPQIGIPGALYCTWSEILLEAPRYMRFMTTLRTKDWLLWWLGVAPPKFSDSDAEPLPEALTGASDDTCIAFIASIASWRNGRLSLDAPRTPLHALLRLVSAYTYDRSHDYEPEARVYTYTPTTLRSLWKQRVRWNSSRFECAGRFWRAFWFHWEIGFLTFSHLALVVQHVFELTLYYVLLPYYVFGTGSGATIYVLGYAGQAFAYALYTVFALMLEQEWRLFLPTLLCVPLSPLYLIGINFFGCSYGVIKDVFLMGNQTNFAPEWTLVKGGTERIAILFRVRRFLTLSLRAVLFGDVPGGRFWFGWRETPWTPNGFEGWTTGKKPRSMLPALSCLWTAREPASRAERTEGDP